MSKNDEEFWKMNDFNFVSEQREREADDFYGNKNKSVKIK